MEKWLDQVAAKPREISRLLSSPPPLNASLNVKLKTLQTIGWNKRVAFPTFPDPELDRPVGLVPKGEPVGPGVVGGGGELNGAVVLGVKGVVVEGPIEKVASSPRNAL